MARKQWAALLVAAALTPALAGEDPRGETLAGAAARVLARKELDGAIVGIDVRSLATGERVWAQGADCTLAPASNLKLVTIALALEVLGPEFQFETPLIASGPIVEGGRLEGDLWVRGSGDPTLQPRFFDSEDAAAPLQPFVQALVLHGVREIRGDLVVDARAFDDALVPDGWPQDQLDRDYAAPVSALSLNGNVVRVRVSGRAAGPPRAELEPDVHGWSLENDLVASGQARALKVALRPPDREGCVVARGSVGSDVAPTSLVVTVPDPPRYFGLALRAALERAGVRVSGTVRAPLEDETPGAKARTLYTRRSPLRPALQVCGKESDNPIAEHLFKACALARFGRGTAEHGATLVQELCESLGVDGARVRVVDGSGLSRLDQVTPAFLAAVLAHAWRAPWRDDFVRCLPIAGVDGTLEKRMTEPEMLYRVRAKTGFIAQVSGLSGFAAAGDESDPEVFAFSILMNGFKGANSDMKKIQDDLCRRLIALPRGG